MSGKYDDIVSAIGTSTETIKSPPPSKKRGKYDDILSAMEVPMDSHQSELKQDYPIRRKLSQYLVHPVIEGGSMAIGGGAAGIAALPAGPLASALAGTAGAVATYPPAHRMANAVDDMMGIGGRKKPIGELDRLLGELQSGAEMEATGRVLPAIARGVSRIPMAKYSEGMTGSPARNYKRAFKAGLPMYGAKGVEEAGENFNRQETRLVTNSLSAREQADMVTSPTGEASRKLNDVMVRWLRGEPISAKDALMARQASQFLTPPGTAKNARRIGKLGQFDDEMTAILAEKDPAMKAASDDYAAAKLKSQMLQPFRVNKTNPDEPSKLNFMIGGPAAGYAAGVGWSGPALAYLASQSPAFHGFVAALSGSLSKLIPKMSPQTQLNLARGLYSSFKTKEEQR